MEIILYITLWLLSGFLAAWIGHKLDEIALGPRDTSIRAVFWMSLSGLFGLALVIFYTLFYSEVMSKPFFKAKGKK